MEVLWQLVWFVPTLGRKIDDQGPVSETISTILSIDVPAVSSVWCSCGIQVESKSLRRACECLPLIFGTYHIDHSVLSLSFLAPKSQIWASQSARLWHRGDLGKGRNLVVYILPKMMKLSHKYVEHQKQALISSFEAILHVDLSSFGTS